MTNQEMFISYINKLTEDKISSLLEVVSLMLETKEPAGKPPCPYCGCGKVIRYGHACQNIGFSAKYAGILSFRLQIPSWHIHTFRHPSGRR